MFVQERAMFEMVTDIAQLGKPWGHTRGEIPLARLCAVSAQLESTTREPLFELNPPSYHG